MLEKIAIVSPHYWGMFKFAQSYPFRRGLVGVLYGLIFAGFSVMAFGLSTAHWIARTWGISGLLISLMAYIAVMTLLFWVVNRVNDAAPTFTLPPGDAIRVGPPIEETVENTAVSLETALKTAQFKQK
ncbi:hypothetical protein FJW05_14880 [Mesorhizobium sp. B2-9-1]|uniref:hypothetical protein n=1 Tax=unclassified Mesorhizobium TaxID=325217 RepID=UPI001126EEB5|nr:MULTISPECIES: hypothetical protein [unclassified Mesorhizobium]TPI46146.1 hypothetical protein FJW05_14880 [Mesorhizobium sp. B2-9-1]TPJ25547.1 hypothetical protein FJ425_18505 [Mesorhizobium sp. B2-7-2]